MEELYRVATAHAGTQLAAPTLTLIRPDDSEYAYPFYDPINDATGLQKKLLSLRHMSSEWFYGLFDRRVLLSLFAITKGYKPVWGIGRLMLLPLLLAGTVVGSSAAIYYKRETPLSAARYKPKTPAEQLDLYCSFMKESWRILQAAQLSFFERLVLTPVTMIHSSSIWKLRRLIRSAILGLFPKS